MSVQTTDKRINILGYGIMGKQIAALFYLGGFEVNIWSYHSVDEAELKRYVRLISRQVLPGAEGKLNYFTDLGKLDDLVTIEAVVENIDIKKELYRTVRRTNKSAYFTNTSSFSPQEIGEGVSLLHFFNPITMGLVEAWYADASVQERAEQVLTFLTSINFTVVPVGDNRGSIANYLLFREIASVLKLMETDAYSVKSIEEVYQKLYPQRNIFTIIDMVGIDVTQQIILNLHEKDGTVYRPLCLRRALEQNILGKKNNTSIKQVLS